MQKEKIKQEFIVATERAGIKIQYYLDTNDECYLIDAIRYVKSANSLLKEISDILN